MTQYRLYDNQTGDILYLLNFSNNPEVNHEERLDKKKVEMMYKKNRLYENLSWEIL